MPSCDALWFLYVLESGVTQGKIHVQKENIKLFALPLRKVQEAHQNKSKLCPNLISRLETPFWGLMQTVDPVQTPLNCNKNEIIHRKPLKLKLDSSKIDTDGQVHWSNRVQSSINLAKLINI